MSPRLCPAPPVAISPRSRTLLVFRAQRGDHLAFEVLLEHYRRDVITQLTRVVKHRPTPELVHEVFIRTFLALPALRRPDRFRPWLLRIAHHTAVDWIRDEVNRREETGHDAGTITEPDAVAPPTPERNLPQIVDHITRLRPLPATVLLLRGLEGKTYREIAVLLSISLPSVKTYLHRARRTLRDQLTRVRGSDDPRPGERTLRKDER